VPLVRDPRFLIGCFTALAFCMPLRYVATNVVVMERLGREGYGRAGWYRGLQLLGMHLVGPSLAVPIVAALGFPRTWWLVAVAFALPAVAARRSLDGGTAPRERAILPALRLAASDPETPLLAVTELTAQGAVTCSAFFLVPVALQRHGLAAPHAAALLGAQAASFVVVLLALGGLASRWDRARLVSIAYGAAGAGLLSIGLARGAAWLWAGGVLLGGGLGLVQMENLIRAARIGARVGQDAASGLQQLAGASGGLATGLLGGLVGKALGPQAVFLLLVPVFAWIARRQLAGAAPLRRGEAHDSTHETEQPWAIRPSIPPASPSTILSAASAASPCSRRPASERCSST
jgi:hypothetical protein